MLCHSARVTHAGQLGGERTGLGSPGGSPRGGTQGCGLVMSDAALCGWAPPGQVPGQCWDRLERSLLLGAGLG